MQRHRVLTSILLFLSIICTSGLLLADQDNQIEDPVVLPEYPPANQFDDCGFVLDTAAYLDELAQKQAGYTPPAYDPQTSGWAWIPIKFHVVRTTAGTGGVTAAQVESALADVNAHFFDGSMIFHLEEINFIDDDYYYYDGNSWPYLDDNFGEPNKINVYLTPVLPYAGLAGRGSKHVFVRSNYVNNGSTLSHEMGHAFGLYHTHTAVGGVLECPNGSNCDVAGDLICDTPADPGLKNHVYTNCVYDDYASPPAGCGPTPYNPDTHNLMSYSYVVCRDHFSAGQIDVIHQYLYGVHSDIPIDPPQRNIYVDDGGSDDNPGTLEYPYASISFAAENCTDGDTIFVSPGTYQGPVIVENDVAIIAIDGPSVTIVTGTETDNLFEFRFVNGVDAILDGFQLQGGWIGVWCRNSSPTITHCILDGQNVDNWAALVLSGNGYGVTGPSPAKVINNVIMNCTNGGLSNFSSAQATIRNNIIVYNQYGIHHHGDAVLPDNDYNDVWENPKGPFYPPPTFEPVNYLGDISAGPNSLNVDPFLSPAYRLYFDSPCIDAGDPDPQYNDPDGTRNDMGAIPGGVMPDPIYVYPGDSIQLAIDTCRGGQEIRVMPGEWTESLFFKGKTIKLIAEEGPENTILNSGNWGYAIDATNGEPEGTLVSGFTIRDNWCVVDVVRVGVGASMKISDCIFEGIGDGCSYHNYNLILAAGTTGNIEISRNLFANNHADNAVFVHSNTPNVKIINNTFDGNRVAVESNNSSTVFKNNIVTNSYEAGVRGVFGDLSYNDVWNNSIDYDGPVAGPGDISADPLFVDAANLDYNLSYGSPCINSGDPAPEYNDPNGTRNDMGAYPFEGRIIGFPLDPLLRADGSVPQKFELYQNNPNPFNPTTTIRFSLPEASHVRVEVFNIRGQKVKTILDERMESGIHRVIWDGTSSAGSKVASGVYFYRVSGEDFAETRKMSLVK